MPGILWLASYPKSGNTGRRVFLANLILDEPEPLPLQRINEVCSSEPNEDWFKPLATKPVSELSERRIAALRTKAQGRADGLNKNNRPRKNHRNRKGDVQGRKRDESGGRGGRRNNQKKKRAQQNNRRAK